MDRSPNMPPREESSRVRPLPSAGGGAGQGRVCALGAVHDLITGWGFEGRPGVRVV